MTFAQMLNSDSLSYDETKKLTTTKPIVEKPKRKQVKNACVNCQKACKKCDDGRPCKRCIKLGITATCRDSDRKERKKGVKRGPYKKRQATNKDKPVYPKLTGESRNELSKPIYENVPQVKSYTQPMTMTSFDQDNHFYVPSQHGMQLLSPTHTNESDETLHVTYGYGATATSFIASSPSMLDHQAISGNVTPLQENFNSWDETLPIGFYPIHDYINQANYYNYKDNYQPQQMNTEQLLTAPFFDFTVPSQSQYVDFWNYN